MICKFNVGDLVTYKRARQFGYPVRVGLIVSVTYLHGNPQFGVLWTGRDSPRVYNKVQLQHA